MRTIFFLLRKEFTQIRRNRSMLPIIFVVPVIQLLILVNAANLEMENIKLCVNDNDMSSASQGLVNSFASSPFFRITSDAFSEKETFSKIESGTADMAMVIPYGFERKLVREGSAEVQLLINAINGTTAGIGNAYAAQIISRYNRELQIEWKGVQASAIKIAGINTIPSFWYNPDLNYKVYMVPAILVILVTIMGMLLAAMNIVREKEMGTIEQINVTPISKLQFVIGKLLPFWIIALFMMSFGLFIGKIIFDIPIAGSLWLLFIVASVYLLVVQGFGLLMSNSAKTQQQALFIAYFFMIVFIMMSGIFTPVESMPDWAQKINYLNPVAYFMKLIRMILIKGSGFYDIYKDLMILLFYGIVMISLAVWRYKKTS